jgi:hypothetical protein
MVLLESASDDFPRADRLRILLQDLREVRRKKSRRLVQSPNAELSNVIINFNC